MKNAPFGQLLLDFEKAIANTERAFMHKETLEGKAATLDDANFYGTMCGSNSSLLQSAAEQMINNPPLLESHVKKYVEKKLCPQNLTAQQTKELLSNKSLIIGAVTLKVGKSGIFSFAGSEIVFKEMNYDQGHVQCKYSLNRLPFNIYYQTQSLTSVAMTK
jgi:hypothetical protein